jgi:hypothetical protein
MYHLSIALKGKREGLSVVYAAERVGDGVRKYSKKEDAVQKGQEIFDQYEGVLAIFVFQDGVANPVVKIE